MNEEIINPERNGKTLEVIFATWSHKWYILQGIFMTIRSTVIEKTS